jgi:hypothetical protein
MTLALLGLPWGAWAIVGGFAATLIGTVIGYYTRTGSGINAHPVDDRGGSQGAQGPATVSGAGRRVEGGAKRRYEPHGTR